MLLEDKQTIYDLENLIENQEFTEALNKIYPYLNNPLDVKAQFLFAKIVFKANRVKSSLNILRDLSSVSKLKPEIQRFNLEVESYYQSKVSELKILLESTQNSDEELDQHSLIIFQKFCDIEENDLAYDHLTHISNKNPSKLLAEVNFKLFKKSKSDNKVFESLKYAYRLSRTEKYAAMAHAEIGEILFSFGKADLAHKHIGKSLEINPKRIEVFNSYVAYTHYMTDSPKDIILNAAKQFLKSSYNNIQVNKKSIFNDQLQNSKTRNLNIGFVSGDFKAHALFLWIGNLFLDLEKEKINTYVYCNNEPDNISQIWQKTCKQWKDIRNLNDKEVSEIIRENQIDILIDLSGHTKLNRLGVFALRSAPIQVSWLGQSGPIGIKEIDYIISDKNYIQPDEERFYMEKVIYMPDFYSSFNKSHGCNLEREIKAPPSLENKFITFGCFNNCIKVNSKTIETWCKLLSRVPDSKLYLKNHALINEDIQRYFKSKFINHGISLDRVILEAASKTRGEYLECYNQIDIALDPFPLGGGTTTVDTLIMGTPIITLFGNKMPHRATSSILYNIKHPELISKNEEEYINKAYELSQSQDRIIRYSKTLRQSFLESPICDTKKFSKNLTQIFRQIIDKSTTNQVLK